MIQDATHGAGTPSAPTDAAASWWPLAPASTSHPSAGTRDAAEADTPRDAVDADVANASCSYGRPGVCFFFLGCLGADALGG